jgi:hypothetical protein
MHRDYRPSTRTATAVDGLYNPRSTGKIKPRDWTSMQLEQADNQPKNQKLLRSWEDLITCFLFVRRVSVSRYDIAAVVL